MVTASAEHSNVQSCALSPHCKHMWCLLTAECCHDAEANSKSCKSLILLSFAWRLHFGWKTVFGMQASYDMMCTERCSGITCWPAD